MKLIHLSDLHLGKRLNEFSLLEDQEYILQESLRIIDEEAPDGVILAGDIYDKPLPPAEAVGMFDDFLTALAEQKVQTFVISGNHDSPERIAFGGRLMENRGIHLSPVYDGRVSPIVLEDDYGPVNFWLLPFVRPAQVRRYAEEEISTYTDALAAVIAGMDIRPEERNVLVTHQFVTGAQRSESEELSVGGSDNVDAAVFAPFDYVALGHIHGPQSITAENIRYSGTPLKYSFSEEHHQKSLTVVQLGKKGEITLRTIPLKALRDMRTIRGSYMELTARSTYEGTAVEDYLHIVLTDEEDIPDAVARLRVIYPNLMKLDYDNLRTRTVGQLEGAELRENRTPMEHFADFFLQQNGRPMSNEQEILIRTLAEKIWSQANETD